MLRPVLCGKYLLILVIFHDGTHLLRKYRETSKGSRIEAFIKPPNFRDIKIKPLILDYHPEKELRWLGRLWIPKLVDGEHSLIIMKIDEKNLLFIQKEKFTGLFVPLLSNMLKDTKSGFER
jgi:hypothetical protein